MGRGGHAKHRRRRAFPPQNRSLCRRRRRGSAEPNSLRPIAPCRSCSGSTERGVRMEPLHRRGLLPTQLSHIDRCARFARLPLHASTCCTCGAQPLLAPLSLHASLVGTSLHASSCTLLTHLPLHRPLLARLQLHTSPYTQLLAHTPLHTSNCTPLHARLQLHAPPCTPLRAHLSVHPPLAHLPMHAHPCTQRHSSGSQCCPTLQALLCSALLVPSAPVCTLPAPHPRWKHTRNHKPALTRTQICLPPPQHEPRCHGMQWEQSQLPIQLKTHWEKQLNPPRPPLTTPTSGAALGPPRCQMQWKLCGKKMGGVGWAGGCKMAPSGLIDPQHPKGHPKLPSTPLWERRVGCVTAPSGPIDPHWGHRPIPTATPNPPALTYSIWGRFPAPDPASQRRAQPGMLAALPQTPQIPIGSPPCPPPLRLSPVPAPLRALRARDVGEVTKNCSSSLPLPAWLCSTALRS